MMGTMAHTALRAIAVLALGFLWGPAYAQDAGTYEDDPPERAARLSYLEGDVSLQPVGEEEWAPAFLNRPLTTGDKLWTERAARAEIQAGPAVVRLDDETGFSFLNVDVGTIQMRLTAGVINVSVRNLDSGEQIEIDTPNVALSLLREGTYRVEVNDAGDSTVVKVTEGAVDATGGSQEVVVHAGQAVTFNGTDDIVAQINTLGPPDGFDNWSQERDRRDDRLASSRTAEYVSPEVTGYEDLDEHGSWSSEAEYGYVWTPRHVAADWAPYRYGRWVSVAPWGWTWIDDASWGYAPFHYGRWAHIRNRWCWVPGPRHIRAVYAPALVGWYGSPGLHVSWYPLSPHDVYRPWRRHSWRYFERANMSNTSRVIRAHIREAYDDRGHGRRGSNRAPVGVTAATRAAFTSAGHVRDHRVRVDERELSRGMGHAIAPQIEPGRESRLGSARPAVRVPPRTIADRQVVARRAPPAVSASLARSLASQRDAAARAPERSARPQQRDDHGASLGRAAVIRDRLDRPRERPPVSSVTQSPTMPAVQPQRPQSDRQAIAERLREAREQQAHRDRTQHQQPDAAVQQRWRTQDNTMRQQQRERPQVREQPQARDVQQRIRERVQHQPARQVEQRQVERPVQRPNVSAPRPQVERQSRSEAPKPAPPPSNAPARRGENFSRPNKR